MNPDPPQDGESVWIESMRAGVDDPHVRTSHPMQTTIRTGAQPNVFDGDVIRRNDGEGGVWLRHAKQWFGPFTTIDSAEVAWRLLR